MPVFPLHYNLLLSQWNLTLPICFKILIPTNETLPKSFEDVGNDLSLYKPMKNNLQAGNQLLFLNLHFFAPPSHFLFSRTKMVYPPQLCWFSRSIQAN